MKPLTPAMLRALRHIRWRVDYAYFLCIGSSFCHPSTLKALQSRGLIVFGTTHRSGVKQWQPTPAGRRVLAE